MISQVMRRHRLASTSKEVHIALHTDNLIGRLVLPLLVACAVTGCGSIIRSGFLENGKADFDFRHPGCPAPAVPPADSVEVRYLGSGGAYIRWGTDAILVGPYFSHAGNVVRAAFCKVRPDETRIREGMEGIDLSSVLAILVGHSHFDHIADVPSVVRDYVPDAPVYANDTGTRMLAAYPRIAASSYEEKRDQWIPIQRRDGSDSAIRFMPVLSAHAPQLCGRDGWPCKFADCSVDAPWTAEWNERRLASLCGGRTHAFVIDLLDEKREHVRYRIYYNDSPAPPGIGTPQPLADGHGYDLAILCMATFNHVARYPETLLDALKPRHVLISHYDDFFAKQSGQWRFAPLLSNRRANQFMTRLRKKLMKIAPRPGPPIDPVCGPKTALWSMPVPHWRLFFTPSTERSSP